MPISNPHICPTDRESQIKPHGNPESESAQPALETSRSQPAPFLQPRQLRCQAALADAENVFSFAADDLADQTAAQPGQAYYASDRSAIISQLANHSIGLLATLEAIILQSCRRCQQLRIKYFGADCLTNGRHASLHGSEEERARVLQQVPVIGNQNRLRQGA